MVLCSSQARKQVGEEAEPHRLLQGRAPNNPCPKDPAAYHSVTVKTNPLKTRMVFGEQFKPHQYVARGLVFILFL